MVRGRGWTSTKVGQVFGSDWHNPEGINRLVPPGVTNLEHGGKGPLYRVNLGTKLPTRTMGFCPPIKDTTIKKRNR